MGDIQQILAMILIVIGMLFCLTTVIGYYRFPDFYSRCHASGLSETLALMFVCLGVAVYSGFNMVTVKVIVLFFAVCVCNPIGSHAIVRAAYAAGHPMAGGDREDQLHAMHEVEEKALTGKPQAGKED